MKLLAFPFCKQTDNTIMAHLPLHTVRRMSTSRQRRVVVTGMGLVTCLGVGVNTVWSRLLEGRCGLGKVEGKGYDQIPCQVVGRVPCGEGSDEFSLQRVLSKSGDRGVTLAAAFALAAAEEALTMAGWKPDSERERERTGVCIGSGMVALEEIVAAGQELRGGGYRKVSPWFVPQILLNIAAGHVSLLYGLKGPNHCVSTACTTGAHSVGDACRFIQHGDADVMLAGGTEGCVGPLAMAGFSRMRALCTRFNDRPEQASRPFDAQREGFVMSEGAGLMVLEDLAHAQQRGAAILGEVLGYGLSGEATHLTAPSQSGSGARRCMAAAMTDGGVGEGGVGHVNAHATSTPIGDAAESRAIQDLLGSGALVTSIKGSMGHLLGAAGSVEAIVTLRSCQTGLVPPTLNLLHPDTACDLDYVTGSPRPWQAGNQGRRIALTNSFGFGGTNASLCLAEWL